MLNACTIIAGNYRPFARVLVDSFLARHPGASFTVLLIDDEQRTFQPTDDRVDWRRLADIGLDSAEVRRLAGIYEVTELATAVKPLLLRKLLDDGCREIVYLDPDIQVFHPLDGLADLCQRHGIVLTPHTMTSYPEDGCQIDRFSLLGAGAYNLGFIGIGERGRGFLDWWWERTRRHALIEPSQMMFTDQRWIDLVPSLFDPCILKDPGYNVAYWNLHGRTLDHRDGAYVVDGGPLRFFHFSGFDPNKPWLLSKHQGERPRILLSDRPALARICREYLTRLEESGIRAAARSYHWSQLPSGLPLTQRMRRLYRNALVSAEQRGEREPPCPFDERDPDAFLDWLNAPAETGPRHVSRYLHSIFCDRVDLQIHFGDIYGREAASAYTRWICDYGAAQEGIPDELLPEPEPAAPAETLSPGDLQEGINVAGYLRAELGIGEAARLLIGAVEAAHIPLSTTTCSMTLSRQEHPFADRALHEARYDLNVTCVNADAAIHFARDVGPGFFAGRHTAGYWFWELEQFPASMHPAFDVVDEVWTATDFIAAGIRAAGRRPVYTIPLPVPVPTYPSSLTRARLGFPDRFMFLFMFDFLSIVERKNPHGLLEAFTQAFAPDEGPILVLKSINGDLRLGELERLRAAAAGRADVLVRDGYLAPEEKAALVGASDCYVSLHRSEGLGLTMAEAMALGKPVIATGYSGNLHFMDEANSYLVDYVRSSVPTGCEPYPTTAHWANPDIGQAAAFLREVYERPDLAAARARKGREDILERHSRKVSAAAVAQRVEAIRRERRKSVAVSGPPEALAEPEGESPPMMTRPAVAPPAAVGADELDALLPAAAESAVLQLSVEGRPLPGVRRAAQRAVFRVLRPMWFQLHRFHLNIVAALHVVASLIRSEQKAREIADARLSGAVERIEEACERVKAQEASIARLEQRLASPPATSRAAAARLTSLAGAVRRLEFGMSALSSKLFAVPYMSDPERFLVRGEDGQAQLGYHAGSQAARRGFVLDFQEVFRGPEALVRSRQRVYVPRLRGRPLVADLGCGRGEMLDVLKDAGIAAIGVDADADMVGHCRAKGHSVEQQDVLEFLRRQAPRSIPAVFSAQVIEHLPVDDLKEFLDLCRSRLVPGGLLIAETVNPHAIEAFKTFHTDLTHQHPIFPEVALALCQLARFEEAFVVFPLGTGVLDEDRRSQGEYAVIATAS